MDSQYKHFLYLTSDVPQQYQTIKQRELFELCSQRVRAHKLIELGLVGLSKKDNYQEFIQNKVKTILEQNDLLLFGDQFKGQKDDDQLSHFFLQIVFAKTDELIRKYVSCEQMILHSRLLQFPNILKDAPAFLGAYGIPCEQITLEEWRNLKVILQDSYGKQMIDSNGNKNAEEQDIMRRKKFYKIPFQHVLKGLAQMRVFMKKGIAYVHEEYILKAVLDTFADRLKKKLTKLQASTKYDQILESDERLQFLVKKLPDVDMSNEQDFLQSMQSGKGQFTITYLTIDRIAKQSFPMCMKYLYDKLLSLHHLKHFGRLQLSLFQKGAGLKVDESLHFWKAKFVGEDQDYNIRHNYGLVGQKIDYNPQSCQTIINYKPGHSEYHGCFFQHMKSEELRKYLSSQGVPQKDIDEIQSLSKEHHHQLACKQTLLALHPDHDNKMLEVNIVHPLSYYQASRRYHEQIENPSKMQEEK